MGFFAGVEGLEGAEVDETERTITASLSLPPSSEKVVAVDVLAPRDSGGDALTLAIHLAHYFSGVEHWDGKRSSSTRVSPMARRRRDPDPRGGLVGFSPGSQSRR